MAEQAATVPRNSKYVIGALLLVGVLVLAVAASWMRPSAVPEGVAEDTGAEEMPWGASGTVSADTRDGYQPHRVSILDMLGKLSVAVLCIYGVIWGLRWWKDKTTLEADRGKEEDLLKIKEQACLGQRQKLYLVEVGKHIILIADGDGELSLLADLPAEEVYPRPSPPEEQVSLPVIDFSMPAIKGTDQARHGQEIRVRSQRDQQDWPRRRELLIRALQQQEG